MNDSGALKSLAGELGAILSPEFEILRSLGEGAMGSVFLAREPALQRLVAIKVPRRKLGSDPIVRKRFEREARAAARIKHPSAVDIHRIGHLPDGIPYLVMEYVEGRTLADVIKAEGPLPEPIALQILEQLAGALADAHSSGILHRDFRPGNVILAPDRGRAVLTDFGIAGILESASESVTRLTMTGQLLGSPAHMSPEQLSGEPLTGATDIFGLGILGYEVLTGQQPYRGETDAELAQAHLRQAPRRLTEIMPAAHPDVARLLENCLALNPAQRPAAASVARTLARIRIQRTLGLAAEAGQSGSVSRAQQSFPAFAGFLAELRRRRVYNVAILYVAVAFAVLEGAELIVPALPVPEWTYTAVVAVTLAGFPIALVLGWAFDITASGIRRAETRDGGASVVDRVLLPAVGLAFSLALAALIGIWIL